MAVVLPPWLYGRFQNTADYRVPVCRLGSPSDDQSKSSGADRRVTCMTHDNNTRGRTRGVPREELHSLKTFIFLTWSRAWRRERMEEAKRVWVGWIASMGKRKIPVWLWRKTGKKEIKETGLGIWHSFSRCHERMNLAHACEQERFKHPTWNDKMNDKRPTYL